MRIDWSGPALAELREAYDHIARESPRGAERVAARIERAVGHLAAMPFMGRPGRMSGTRELPVSRTPYVVIYEVGQEVVRITRVLHGARRWPPAD